MRIAAGILLILVGLWGAVGNGFSVAASASIDEIAQSSGVSMESQTIRFFRGYRTAGLVGALGGLLSVVAGIMFLFDRGKLLGFLALGVAINAQAMVTVLVPPLNPPGVLKILVLIFCTFGATRVGTSERPQAAR